MTPEIVTMQEAKLFLRYDGDDEDLTFQILIAAATEAALRFANNIDPANPPPSLKVAILTHIGQVFRDRESGAHMPESSERLLAPLRRLDI